MTRSTRVALEHIQRAKIALKRNGFPSQKALADELKLSRSTTDKFFAGKPVDHRYFLEISERLGLDWQAIAYIGIQEEPASTSKNILDKKFLNCDDDIAHPLKENANETIPKRRNMKDVLNALISSDINEEQKQTHEERAAFVVVGTISKDDISKLKAIASLLQDLTGDTSIKIVDIEQGSVKLILEGSQQSLEQIEALFKAGQLTEVLGIPIQDVQFVDSTASELDKDRKAIEKKRLAFTIVGNISEVGLQELKAVFNQTSLKYPKKFSKRVLTDLNKLAEVLSWFEHLSWSEQMYQPSISEKIWRECEKVLLEGFINAVRHAHSGFSTDVPIDIEVTLFSNSLEIRILDQGPPFNLKEKLQAQSLKETKQGLRVADALSEERGFSFLQKLGDKLSYIRTKDNRNCFLYQSSTY